ncbi:hypothetical protein RYX36_024706 [Vicia faba]
MVFQRHEEYMYLNLVQEIISQSTSKGDRTGIGTLSKFGCQMRFNLHRGLRPEHLPQLAMPQPTPLEATPMPDLRPFRAVHAQHHYHLPFRSQSLSTSRCYQPKHPAAVSSMTISIGNSSGLNFKFLAFDFIVFEFVGIIVFVFWKNVGNKE